MRSLMFIFFFFFNDTATTEIYTLSLHDALPIFRIRFAPEHLAHLLQIFFRLVQQAVQARSEEHTSELQSLRHLVCRLLLEKKKQNLLSPSCMMSFLDNDEE